MVLVRIGQLVVAAVIAGCYSPQVTPGAPCSTEGTCPSGLLCVAGLCQLGAGEPDAPGDAPGDTTDAPADVPDVDAAIDAAPLVWSTPVAIASLDGPGAESDASLTADLLTVVFTRDDDLYLGTRTTPTGAFTVIELVFLNSFNDEQSPEISPDGTTLYFTSDRLQFGNNDVYVSTRSGGIWSAPVRVPELSSAADDGDLAISPDGLTAVLERSGGFHRATRATTTSPWGPPTAIAGVTWGSDAAAPSLTAAGDLYFHATLANRDVFVARKNGTSFLAPVPVTELNTAGRDASPFVSGDERYVIFERSSNLYEARR